jgi:hypothetical protein
MWAEMLAPVTVLLSVAKSAEATAFQKGPETVPVKVRR